MWCEMVVDNWKADPCSGYVDCPEGIEGDEDDDKVGDHIPTYPPRDRTPSLSRSASCNRINLALPNRKPKRSLSTSGVQRPEIRKRTPENSVSTNHLDREPPKEREKLKRSTSVLTRLARQYSFTRSRRTSSNSTNMNVTQPSEDTTVVTKGRSPRRRRNKNNSKKDGKSKSNQGAVISPPTHLELPKSKQGRIPSPLHNMTIGNSHINGDSAISSPDSCPNSPSHFNKATFSISPPTPTGTEPPNNQGFNAQRTTSPISADESPLPSPPVDEKAYDSGRNSLSSFRSFGSSGGRPTSLSSVTSSISSRTSRGSDYFSSASSTDQVTSYRMQTVLPNLDESDCVDRLVSDQDGNEEKSKNVEKDSSERVSAFIAHDRHNRDLNDVDHLAPVANLAMAVNPDLSYVDRVILELLETERMYVRSLRDILKGYLAVIRSTPELNIRANDVDDLFGNIRDVYDFNRNLLGELEDCCGDPRRIAECFVAKDEDFKVYTEYCTNYPSSVAAMTRCMRNPNLGEFFKVQQDKLRHTLPLGSYLLKPVQRVLKYHLLLQELVKHCDKEGEGYQTIQNALQTMTKVARHINEMKRKHEDAVHIQEIQSLLMNWQGNELTTYGELILESEMKMQGAKNERQVFLFEKMILITKRREDGYLVCKTSIMCAKLVLLESIPNTPLGFQIQPFTEKGPQVQQMDPNRVERYILLAPTQEEKTLWTYNIKRRIIETLTAAVPLEAKKSIMRMRPVRDGDGDGDSEEDRMRKKSKNRFGSTTILGNQDNKSTKSPLSLFTGNASNTNHMSGSNPQSKPRRRSDSMSRKSLHKRALQKKKDDIESSDDISADSGPNTPSGLKVVSSKFTFPFRQSTRSTSAQQQNKLTTTQAQSKNATAKTTSSNNTKKSAKEGDNKKSSNQNGEVVKRHHNSVIYRRHKRRTSQPITITEKRLSMKIDPDDDENGNPKEEGGDVIDDDDLMNFNPLTARESVSWDIQIVEAVFERYKNEASSPASPPENENEELESTYLTLSSDVAPSPLMALDHTPVISDRRKSRIIVMPSSDSSEEEMEKKKPSASSAVLRRRKSKGSNPHRTSGVVYALSQELEVESDSGLNETKAILRKVVQASESARKSLVIHESDTEADTNRILKEKASTVRRKTSLKRRERNARRKNGGNASEASPSKSKERQPDEKSRGSPYDNLDEAVKATVTSSVQSLSTQTISMVDCSTKTTTRTVQCSSASASTSTIDVISANNNNSNNNTTGTMMTSTRGKKNVSVKDMKHIPTGKVRGLIKNMWNSPNSDLTSPPAVAFSSRKTPVTSPTFSTVKDGFSFEPKSVASVVSPSMWNGPRSTIANSNSNNNNSYIDAVNPASSEAPNRMTDPINHKFVTTASLPLTITSSSSSDSEEESRPSIVQRVKRLSIHERGGLEISEDATISALYLRRTFSQEDSNSNTRRSRNLFLEARISGEYGDDPVSASRKTSSGGDENPESKDAKESFAEEDFKFSGVVEDVHDAKHYLLEKLCLAPPGESKITDKMSEEFEHVCSDLENNNRLGVVESHAFSASDEDSFTSVRKEKTLRRVISPLVTEKGTAKHLEKGKAQIRDEPAKANAEKCSSASGISAASTSTISLSQPEAPKILGTKATQSTSNLRKYGQQYGRNILPNRSESIRSTKSEYGASRWSADTRGRSQTPRGRNSFKLPSKDMQAIPQKNVARLAKQFSEICKDSEKLAPTPPRRSRSVEGGTRRRQRAQALESKKKSEAEDEQQDMSPKRESTVKSSSTANIVPARNQESPKSTRSGKERKKYFEKASVKVDEMFVCEAVDNSRKLQTVSVLSSPEIEAAHMEDDVFPTSPQSPTPSENNNRTRSLVEMFAANPRKNSEIVNENPLENLNEKHAEEEPSQADKPGDEGMIQRANQSTPSVRVFLVPKSDEVGGSGNFEPRVLNLSPSGKDSADHPPLEKRRSWTKLTTHRDEQPKRTRLRSSSLTRNRRRELLTSDA